MHSTHDSNALPHEKEGEVTIVRDQPEPSAHPIILHSKPWITQDDRDAVSSVLESGMIGEGTATSRFENAVSEYIGVAGGVAAATGTTALIYALKALDIDDQDEVIMPTFVCRAVMDAVTAVGAKPVFCDIGEDWCVNSRSVEDKITGKTKAIIIVHNLGISADIQSVLDLGVPVIEDFCPAFGGKIGGRSLGTFGTISVASFHGTKPLTTGEGGMALSDNPGLLEKMRLVKNGNSSLHIGRLREPMTDLQASLGLSQLKRYSHFLNRRREIADTYFTRLADLPVKLPYSIRTRSIFFRFPILIREDFKKHLSLFAGEGINVRGGTDFLLHQQSGVRSGSFPMAERLFPTTLSIPIYPALSSGEVERVISAFRHVFQSGKR